MRKHFILSTIAFLLLLVWKVSSSTSILTACECRDQSTPVTPAHWGWRSTHARDNLHFIVLYISWLAIAFVLVGLRPAVKTLVGLVQAVRSRKKPSILLACLLLQPFHVPLAEAATFMYPNGTSVVDFPHDVVFKSGVRAGGPSGILFDTQNKADITFDAGPDHAVQLVTSRFDLVGTTLNLTGLGQVNFDQILSQSLLINGTLITTTASDIDIVLSPKGGGSVNLGNTLDVRGVTLLLDDDQISGDKIEGGVISTVTITNLTTTQLNIEIIGTDVKLAAGKTLDVSEGTLQLRDGQISGDKVRGGTIDDVTITKLKAETLTGNMSLAAGRTLDVSQGSLIFAENQISGDSINGGTIDATTITTLTAGTVKANTLTGNSGNTVTLASGKTLDVSQGTLQLADGQISGDKIKGGSILVTNLTATRINVDTIGTTVKIAPGKSLDVRGATLLVDQMSVDNLKLDGNAVRSTSGDLELMCPAGLRVKVGETLAVGKLVMSGNTLNTSEPYTDLVLSPYGLGSVKVAEGKTLDLRGVTLLLDNDAIRGDKVDGGTIHNITIVELTSGVVRSGLLTFAGETISGTGDIQLKPGTGRKVEVTKPLEVQDLHLQGTTIATTTGVPVTINNMTCPVATIGSLKLQGNTITANGDVEIAGDKVILQSNVKLANGKTITGSEATFTSVKTSTISTTSGDLTMSPTGSNVKVASGKTLDLSEATLKLDDNAISGDNIEGGTIHSVRIGSLSVSNNLTLSSIKPTLEYVSVSGGVVSDGGFRNGHAWYTGTARRIRLAMATNGGGGLGSSVAVGGLMTSGFFDGYDASDTRPGNMKGFFGAVFDGRYVYFVPHCVYPGDHHGRVLRYDTTCSFTTATCWVGYDANATTPGNMAGFYGGIFDGRHVYFVPNTDGVASSGRVLRYDTWMDFTSASSWKGYDASGTAPGSMRGYIGASFDGKFIYFAPYRDGPSYHGRVLRHDTSSDFSSPSSWIGFDASTTEPGNMKGFHGCIFVCAYIYFVPSYNGIASSGSVLRLDTAANFTSTSSWNGFDAASIYPGNMKGYEGASSDGRFVYFSPYYHDGEFHGRVLRLDTQGSFTSSSSWTGHDASETPPGNMKGYQGSVYDGKYVYFVPYWSGESHGRVLRYDTTEVFSSAASWTGLDARDTMPGSMKGFIGAVFDGRHIYFAPYFGGGRVLRYDTRAPLQRPSIQQIASNSDLFISSQSNVGIGTTSPSQKLHVQGSLGVTDKVGVGTVNPSTSLDVKGTARADHIEAQTSLTVGANTTSLGNSEAVRVDGGVGAKGGFRDSHAWSSETARRSQLALAMNSGGLGSTMLFTGGPMYSSSFDGYDASNTSPGGMKGFYGAVFDGRFVYFVPNRDGGSSRHGRVLRYDTQSSFTSSSSWTGYDASGTSPGNVTGLYGAVFDGRFVYFVPWADDSGGHARVLRYDTQSSFTSSSSWIVYDAANTPPGGMKSFQGAVFDGIFVYFVPNSGKVLRYDTQSSFTSSSSWTGYDASNTPPGNMKGFCGAVFDGRFVYFVPYTDGTSYHGRVLRYDTESAFTSSSSWTGYDVSNTPPGDMRGFVSAVFDGRFIYFVPLFGYGGYHGRVLRYDTQSSFTSSSSWAVYDAANTPPGAMKGFNGAVFDGRFVYFVPGHVDGIWHGRVLRYDTQSSFASSSSWSAIDASSTSPGNMKSFYGAVFDGRYIYFAPWWIGSDLWTWSSGSGSVTSNALSPHDCVGVFRK